MTLKELKELRNSLVKYMQHYDGAYTLGLTRPLYAAIIEHIDLIETGYVINQQEIPATTVTKEQLMKYKFISLIEAEESDGIKEWFNTLVVLHNGLEFDFNQPIGAKDLNGQEALLYALQDQGKCLIT